MSIGDRIVRLERDHFAEACHQFRPWFLEHLCGPVATRDHARLVAAGMPASAPKAEVDAWFATQPQTPAERAWDEAVDPVMELLLEHPADQAALRAALARLAPHLGLRAGDPPLAILAELRAGFDIRAAHHLS